VLRLHLYETFAVSAAQLKHIVASYPRPRVPQSFPTRRSSDLVLVSPEGSPWDYPVQAFIDGKVGMLVAQLWNIDKLRDNMSDERSEEHTSELQSRENLVCRLLLEKNKAKTHSCGATPCARHTL